MNNTPAGHVRQKIDELYRFESCIVYATLVRLLGDFDLAEEAVHDAFASAMETWQRQGVPTHPRAWLVSAGRFKAIDAMRRRTRFDVSVAKRVQRITPTPSGIEDVVDAARFKDDHLRLIFTCCHPALSPNTQVALTLREVCGLTTEEIARAFLSSTATIAQRIVRGKAKLVTRRFPTKCRPWHLSLSDSMLFSPSSTSCSTKGTPPHWVMW